MRYFVYELWNPIKNQPFYVGIGDRERKCNGFRPNDHLNEAKKILEGSNNERRYNKHKINTIIKIWRLDREPSIRIVYETEKIEEAFNKEIELISFYGRNDLRLGPLTNMTDGGDGGKLSDLTIKKMRLAAQERLKDNSYKKELIDCCKINAAHKKDSNWSDKEREAHNLSYFKRLKKIRLTVNKIFVLYDNNISILQISKDVGISWHRTNVIINRRNIIEEYFDNANK